MSRTGQVIMWSETAVRTRMERDYREVFRLTGHGWEPPVDVLESGDGLLVIVALPGVRPDDMETVIGHGELRVRGTRRWPVPHGPLHAHRIELPHGSFERRLPLPHGRYELVGQEHEDGCLMLTLRRLD